MTTTAPEALPFHRSREEREHILAEKIERWRAFVASLKQASDALAGDFDSEYQEAINTVLNLFSRMETLASRAAWLRRIRPAGPLLTTEMKDEIERKLQEFERAPPDFLRLSRLYDPNGKQVWPPPEWETAA
jgi:hypothetical protein